MSDQKDRPECPNTPKYPCGDCPACRVPDEAGDQQAPAPATAPEPLTQPPATPSTADLPAGPALAPGVRQVDSHGFGGWPSDEMIRAHEERGGRWLARINSTVAWLGYFSEMNENGFEDFWPAGRPSPYVKSRCESWTFCPIDENGDKLDAAPALRGEDARRLAEQLGQVAPPEEIARRREEARRRLAENEAVASFQRARRLLNLRPLTPADRCPSATST